MIIKYLKKAWNIRVMYDPKDNLYWSSEKLNRKKLIHEKPVKCAENVNLPKKESDLH